MIKILMFTSVSVHFVSSPPQDSEQHVSLLRLSVYCTIKGFSSLIASFNQKHLTPLWFKYVINFLVYLICPN